MSSVYGKLRKAAKDKTKGTRSDNTGIDEVIVPRDVAPVDPISAEELNTLLSAIDEPKEETILEQALISGPQEAVKATPKPEKKYFKAYGVYFDSERKKFVQISIDYEPKTCYTSIVGSEDIADSNAVATAKIMKVVNFRLGRNEDIL